MNSKKTWICFWLIAILLSMYVRLYPLRAHIWDPAHDQATMYVIYNLKKALLETIHKQAPDMPFPVAEQMATNKLNETLRLESNKIQSSIDETSAKIFNSSGQKPNIYLLESDTFYFYYLTQNILNTGHMADIVKGSKYLDPLMAAPDGFWQPNTFHPYVGFWIYKILKIFDPSIPLMSAVAYTPLVLMVLVITAFFWAFYALNVSAPAAFLGSLSFALAPIILKRSALGWFRTDPYNLLFAILLLVIIIKLITDASTRNTYINLFLFGLIITAFAAIWQGWPLMLIMALAIIGIGGCYCLFIKDLSNLRRLSLLAGGILVATLIGISLLFGFNDFFALLKEAFGELQKFTVKKFGLWPNLFMEVGELKKSTPQDFVSNCGGLFFLASSCAGAIYCFWQIFKKKQQEYTLQSCALLTFLVICILMSMAAERFSIFVMIGFSLFFGLFLEGITHQLSKFKMPWLTLILVLGLTIFMFVNANQNIRNVLTPIFNSAWEKALLDVKNKTPEDSIINTWWPPGHFIKGIAHRKVMFDGATLSQSATGYWMANILLNDNEKTASQLLRMINSSGNKAVDFLVSKGFKTSQAVALLTTLASKSNTEVSNILKALLPNPQESQTLMALIRGENPHSYVLLYNELVDQNLGLAFMGRWNIARVEALNENPALLSSVPARNSAAYLDFLWDLAGGQTHYSSPLQLIHEDETNLYFTENLIINKSSMKAKIDSSTYGKGSILSVVYLNHEQIKEDLNFNADLKYAVVLYTQDKQKLARLMDRNLANSLLIKLFFFDAQGMEHFKLLTSSNDLTNRTQIKIFESNW